MPSSATAAGGSSLVTEAMTAAFTTALDAVKGDVSAMVTLALPVGLAIMGLFLAIRLGIGFFRSIAN